MNWNWLILLGFLGSVASLKTVSKDANNDEGIDWENCERKVQKSWILNEMAIIPNPLSIAKSRNITVTGNMDVGKNFTGSDTFEVSLEIEKFLGRIFFIELWIPICIGRDELCIYKVKGVKCEDILENCPFTTGMRTFRLSFFLPETYIFIPSGVYRVHVKVIHEQSNEMTFCMKTEVNAV